MASLIESSNEQAVKSAVKSLSGGFASRINAAVDALTTLRVEIEAGLDFADEDVNFISDTEVLQRTQAIEAMIKETKKNATIGRVLQEGIQLLLLGPKVIAVCLLVKPYLLWRSF